MTQPNQPPAITTDARYCCHCGKLTREPIVVARAFSSSGAGSAVYACPDDAPRYRIDDGSQP
jgi:hypothetical protein